MANTSIGKKFESKFSDDWKRTMSNSFCYRLKDIMNGYKGISQVSDFICYKKPTCWLIECKAKSGNTFPWQDLRQYDELLQYKDIPGLRAGVVLWFYDHNKVLYVPITEIEKMKNDGKKSINIKMLEEKEYNIIEIPSVKKKVFMDSDYSILEYED